MKIRTFTLLFSLLAFGGAFALYSTRHADQTDVYAIPFDASAAEDQVWLNSGKQTKTKEEKMNEKSLVLYHSTTCPFCRKVTAYMNDNGIEIPTKETSNPKNRQELIEIGGKPQVPCLVIDGKALYESDDIIDWMEENIK